MQNTTQLDDSERQPCEVWTRVMGYHRPVSQFNRGKKEEHAERRHFVEHPLSASTASATSRELESQLS
ncbi:MAG: anaerobic ribonucleoside-triphosphate reductase [bacterium]